MNKKLLVTFLFLSIVELYSMDKKLHSAFLNALSDAMYFYENSKNHAYPYTEKKREYFKQRALIDVKFARDFQEIIKTNQEIIKNELEIKQLKEEWKQKEKARPCEQKLKKA